MLNKIRTAITPKPARPFHMIQIEPTLLCNICCVMCPWVDQRKTSGGQMTWDTFHKIAENLHLAQEVDLSGGGEPLCNPLLTDMVRVVKAAGCRVGFSTNGSLLSLPLAEDLVRSGLDWISFSVDAAEADTYESIRKGASFSKLLSNIDCLNQVKRSLHKTNPKMMMVFVIMTGEIENYQQLPELVELAHRLGVEKIIAKNLDVILKDSDEKRRLFNHDGQVLHPLIQTLDEAEARAKKLGINLRRYSLHPSEQIVCEQSPTHNLFFSWDGSLSPCISLSYTESRIFNSERIQVPSQRFGNIHQHSLAELWETPAYRSFRQAYQARLHFQQKAMLDAFLGSENQSENLPPAPEPCRSCYFLYGI